MHALPTLRRELIVSLAVVFAGALLVAVAGIVLLLPRFESATAAAAYVTLLLIADLVVFAYFGRNLVEARVLRPLDQVVEGVEAIAAGDYGRRLLPGETREVVRLQEAVNRMAEGLISHRTALAANVRSLEETNRQLTETRDELIRAEKMASVGRLAAGIAHEVGNPLGAILGYLGVLRRKSQAAPVEVLQAAESEARRIDRIVRGLLDYARTREARAEPMDVNDVVESALELLTTQGRFADVELTRDMAAELPQITGDRHQLVQVLVNLILNAMDAMADSRSAAITVGTRARVHEPKLSMPARRRDDPPDVDYSHRRRFHQAGRIPRVDPFEPGATVVEIEVTDNGPGVPPELIDQIFEPFVTTKEPGKGTGLGLAVAAGLVHNMGGTIRAESTLGSGTSFTIVLPSREQGGSQSES